MNDVASNSLNGVLFLDPGFCLLMTVREADLSAARAGSGSSAASRV